jgi:hypothetical protein
MAIRAYSSPGVSVIETINPALAPLVALPNIICIVGAASGSQLASERLILSGTTAVTLRYTGVQTGTVVVTSGATNEVLNHGNWALVAGADPDATITGDEPYTIARVASPAAAPVVANSGTGTLNGTYKYAVSFVNANGETGVGPASAGTTFNGSQGANLTSIPLGVTGTTARNIYRAKVTGGITGTFRLVGTIGDNTTTILSNENTSDVTADAAAAPKTGIADGDTVVVSYSYVNQYYYQPTYMSDYDDIVDKYGAPFDASGNIVSPLSFAARLAFQNGASEIVTLAALSGSDNDLSAAFAKLEEDPNIRMITVASGSSTVHAALVAHVTNMNTQGFYRQAIVGRDGSATVIQAQTLRDAAVSFNNEAIIFVSPANFIMQHPTQSARTINVGGQYAAAAIAGMFAARDLQVPLTRKTVAGFQALGDRRTTSEQAIDSRSGLFVILDNGGVLQVRHQVTTAVTNVNTAEASVVRAKYEMAHRLRQILDGSIVGQIIPDVDVPLRVGSVVQSILEGMLTEGLINGYGNVKARLLDTDATTVEVRYEYRPAFPINNVVVRFTINTTTGDLTVV